MKKTILYIFIGFIFFLAGWFSNELIRFTNGMKQDHITTAELNKNPDSIRESIHTTGKENQSDSIIKYSNKIKGRFILNDANCAGFEFVNHRRIIWRNEITCFDPDTLAITWLDNKTFMIKDIKRFNEKCPPEIGFI